MKPSPTLRALRTFSIVAGLALAIGATACAPSEEEDTEGSQGALNGTPSSDRPGDWMDLYAKAYADDFEVSQCPREDLELPPPAVEHACLAVNALKANSPTLYKWTAKRPVANGPREDVGTAYLVNAKTATGGLVLVIGPLGECLLSGITWNSEENYKVRWDRPADINCRFRKE